MKKIIFAFVFLFSYYQVFAVVSTTTNFLNYYSTVDGKTGNAIRLALEGVIDGHIVVSYDNLYRLYVASDSHSDNSMWDMYSTCSWTHGQKKCGNYSAVCDCYNREHSVPQSWFDSRSPMVSDAFHVYPTDGKVNGQRSNYMFGECSSGKRLTNNALGRLGTSTFSGYSYSGTVFEPDDEYKGDFARTYFYMATRYASSCSNWGNHFSTANSGLSNYSVALFLKWHREDPVSEKELIRNEAIFGNPTYNSTGYKQGNRNPFIDFPCLAEYIWGEYKGQSVDFSKLLSAYSQEYASSTDKSGCACETTSPTIIAPKTGESVNLGGASLNEPITSQLLVSGRNLTNNVVLTITGTNASYFSLSKTNMAAATANSGQYVTISYTPLTTGEHSALLTVSSQGATAVSIPLSGRCIKTIVSPSETFYFETTDATSSVENEILVKGTNLTSGITLSLSGKGSSNFSLAKTTLTAAEAKAGTNVLVTYSPTTLGCDTATLVVASETVSTTTNLIGECTFEALEATDLTSNSFVANWTNAGVENYSLAVYTKETVGNGESVLLEDPCDNETVATTSGSVNYDVNNCIRLGSSSKTGSITYSNLDLSKGGRVIVNAQYYNNDSGTQMKISAGGVTKTFTLTTNFADYELEIPANNSNTSLSVVIESLVNSKRVNVNNVKILVGGETIESKMLVGYPKNVGNVQSYLVEGIDYSEEKYYYTVTPQDHQVSNEILVGQIYGGSTVVEEVYLTGIRSYLNENNLIVDGVEIGSVLTLFNPSGTIFERTVALSKNVQFALPMHGVWIVCVEKETGGKSIVVKTIY